MSYADRILINGTILTVNSDMAEASAVAIKDGLILAVGDYEQVMNTRGPETKVLDLDGATAMPGFVEAHGHPLLSALTWGDPVIDIRAIHTPTYDAAIEKVKRRILKSQPGEFLFFVGLDPLLHNGMREPSSAELDALAPDNPLVIETSNCHAIYVNGRALERCGINAETPVPEGGEIIQGTNGKPWKFLESAIDLITDRFYEITGESRTFSELRSWLWKCSKAGFTTSSEIALWPSYIKLYERVIAEDRMPIRVIGYEMANSQINVSVQPSYGDDLFKVVGIKIVADGSPFLGNIWLSRPYLNTDVTLKQMGLSSDETGHMSWEKDELYRLIDGYSSQGWQIAVHVQGDRTIETVLDVFEEVLAVSPSPPGALPLRLEHCGLMTESQIKRAHRLGVVCSFFIAQIYYWGEVVQNGLFGAERASHYMPSGTATRMGMRVSYHCDPPMTFPDALMLLHVAVTRRTEAGGVIGEGEKVGIDDALRAMTIDAAWQMGMDDRIGSLEPGKLADIVVLSSNPRTHDPERLMDISILGAFIEGDPVWSEPSLVWQ